MFGRHLKTRLEYLAQKYPIVALTGPRQAGKTTLLKATFPNYKYVSLENLNNLEFASNDPVGFLKTYDNHVIIDEIQREPKLFNYLQEKVDAGNTTGQYLISGSQNFQLMEKITQSLAGRVALLNLLPLSWSELHSQNASPTTLNASVTSSKSNAPIASSTPNAQDASFAPSIPSTSPAPDTLNTSKTSTASSTPTTPELNTWILQGGFPLLHAFDIEPSEFYPSYISTYLERDVRTLSNVVSLDDFKRFMAMCAGRAGNILDMNNLANAANIDIKTAKNWLSVLSASYIIDLVPPYFKNFNKRLVKRKKLYFCDTGLACALLGLTCSREVELSAFRGALFENLIYTELKKQQNLTSGVQNVWFWHETNTNEVDFIFGPEHNLNVVEVKSSATYDIKWFKSMKVFTNLASVSPDQRYIVYTGDELIKTSQGNLVPWRMWPSLDNVSLNT